VGVHPRVRRLRVLGHVGQTLGDREVGGALDRRGHALLELRLELDGERGACRNGLEARVEPALREHRGVDARGQLAQLVDRSACVLECPGDELARELRALVRELQPEQDRDQPLLRAVVEVTAEATALLVAGRDDPRPRRPQRLEARAQLGLEPRVLERERGRSRDRAQDLGLRQQRRVVDERADAVVAVGDLGRDLPGARRRELDRATPGVDVAALVGQPVGDGQLRVLERLAERRLEPASARLLGQPLDQPADRGGAEETDPAQAEQEGGGQDEEGRHEDDLRRGRNTARTGESASCPRR